MGDARTPVVLLHSRRELRRWWRRSVEALAVDRSVVPLEVRGLGRRRARIDLAAASAAVAERVEATELAPVDLVGHAHSALLCARLAADRPELVRRLVLVAPAGGGPGAPARDPGHGAAPARPSSPSLFALVAAGAAGAGPVSHVAAARSLAAQEATVDFRAISAPTLLVLGERDPLAPPALADAWLAAIPGARLVLLPQTGHVPMHERPDAFSRLTRDFLDAV